MADQGTFGFGGEGIPFRLAGGREVRLPADCVEYILDDRIVRISRLATFEDTPLQGRPFLMRNSAKGVWAAYTGPDVALRSVLRAANSSLEDYERMNRVADLHLQLRTCVQRGDVELFGKLLEQADRELGRAVNPLKRHILTLTRELDADANRLAFDRLLRLDFERGRETDAIAGEMRFRGELILAEVLRQQAASERLSEMLDRLIARHDQTVNDGDLSYIPYTIGLAGAILDARRDASDYPWSVVSDEVIRRCMRYVEEAPWAFRDARAILGQARQPLVRLRWQRGLTRALYALAFRNRDRVTALIQGVLDDMKREGTSFANDNASGLEAVFATRNIAGFKDRLEAFTNSLIGS